MSQMIVDRMDERWPSIFMTPSTMDVIDHDIPKLNMLGDLGDWIDGIDV